ncbi:4-(cytidine 5'-diphospho)-2-C-methyl-D-erythritol kinase [Pararhizobium haloflavum]|uniref:4-(cytidine 5'-diphospho)-2-C-methyl-D-erythritol kinase n=1 Tax=Pararhizobium haloflavum TaxID=2037914 RepID=UPI000C19E9D5|nr:4-(cytidine 5'-diphospho)-2-C-methyl-D-erythritol kinase [Pararhizobium haloflavum]
MIVEERAFAKVNLALHVVGRRADGYHLLESLVVFCDLGDYLTFRDGAEDAFTLAGPFATDLSNTANIVLEARDRLRVHSGRMAEGKPVAIHLDKHLPVASGIGGGSADAAATLRGLCRLWRIGPEGLEAVAQELGADVPMCLANRPLRAEGIGETLAAVDLPVLHLVVVNPGVAVSTPSVFKALARTDNPPLAPATGFVDTAGLVDYLQSARNDLQAAATLQCPPIATVLDALSQSGALFARMSGSGATCFGIFATQTAAKDAAAQLQARHAHWYIEATTTRASEAAHATA